MDKHQIKQLEKVQQWLKEYDEWDVDNIISYFEESQAREEKYKNYYRERRLQEQQEAEDAALLCLKVILHKKLFNMECQWRANEVELPLDITWSFHKYENNLFEATFLEPITQEELDTFIDYCLSDEYEHFDLSMAQNYEKLVAYGTGQKYNTPFEAVDRLLNPDPHYPHWYAWYDRHFGTGELLKLPDERGDGEQVLLSAYHKGKGTDMSGIIEGFQNIGKTKTLVAFHPDFMAFAEHIGDHRMRTFFKTQTEHLHEFETEDGKRWINYLENIFYQKIPISAADDWRKAVREAGFRHLQQNTAKVLPALYDQYLHDPDFRSRHFDEEEWKRSEQQEEIFRTMFKEGGEYLKQMSDDDPEG